MNRDTHTFPLFAGELLPTSPWTTMPTMPAHWPTPKRENFTWWCQNGNKEMCAAVLRQSNGLTNANAPTLVQHLAAQPVTLLHESPPCAHFARPMASAGGATA